MSYRVKIFQADAAPAELREAAGRFRQALDDSLGDAALVVPVFQACQRILATHGESADQDSLSEGEWLVLSQWRAAETAAVAAAFGSHRYMGDAMYQIEIGDP